ncbi:hypothetical protein WJX75_005185 [Coccomyxa subellipsoidea]|uniref:G-patch domain-containing protein n=1 Tax=Coccomyxa subellipsoidea TaxID=248742 RepID=A0ABR2Z3P4_9CHLO
MPTFTRGGTIQGTSEVEDVQIAEFYKQLVGAGTSVEPWAGLQRPGEELQDRLANADAAGPSGRIEERATALQSLQQAFATQPEVRKAKPREEPKGIGYALLAKAGWTGGGLGAQEQGITTPLPAWHQKGRRGIGAASGQPPKPVSSAVAAVPGQAQPGRGRGREASTQSLGVMQAEADDAAEKALARELYRAFNDSSGYSSTDTNPLLRKSKLSDSNPLL